ncbi:MAG: hypothetical protein WDO24_21730 [Pseudomonadota bacterium]
MLNAAKVIDAGYTTIRDVGTIGNVAVTIRNAVAQHRIRGPRVVASGPILCPTAGLGDTLPPHWTKSHGLGRAGRRCRRDP